MVFIGSWRPRRRGYGNTYGGYGSPYGRAGYGGSSCGRDLCLLESGCCLADMIGCGPQLTLLGPSMTRRSFRAATLATAATSARDARAWTLAYLQSAIRIYQQEISSRRRSHCPYTPSCSHYAAEALDQHGLRRGAWLAVRRLVRCRPGTPGGADPVPPAAGS